MPVIKALKIQHHLSPFGSHISTLGPYSQADYEIRPAGEVDEREAKAPRQYRKYFKEAKEKRGEGVWDDKLTA